MQRMCTEWMMNDEALCNPSKPRDDTLSDISLTHSRPEKLSALNPPPKKKIYWDVDIFNTHKISYIHPHPQCYADISYWCDMHWNVRLFRCDAPSPPVPFVAKWRQPRQYSPDVRRCAEVWVFTDSFLHTLLLLMRASINLSQRKLGFYCCCHTDMYLPSFYWYLTLTLCFIEF